MGFSNDGRVQFYNLNSQKGDWAGSPYKYICFAVIAPRGYRFTEYWMSIDGSQHNGANGATITRYTYNQGSTYQYTLCAGESLALTSETEQIFSHTLSNAENLLYFRIEVNNASTQACVTMNQLRLTYVIDSDVKATIPNSDGTKVHTGIVNLGTFVQASNSDYYFNKANVTDLEDVNIVADNGTSAISVTNGAIEVPAGTYWIESPAKFRFTGAKLNFKQATAHTETTYTNLGQDLQAALGQTVKIGNGSNFIVYNSGNSFSNGTQATGTTWVITKVEGTDNKYYIQNEIGNYLKLNSSFQLTVAAGAFEWTYYEEYDNGVSNTWNSQYRHQTSDHCFIYVNSSNGRHYGLQLYGNTWRSVSTNQERDNRNYIPTPISFVKAETTTYGAEDFVATVYGTSATVAAGTASISTSNPTGSVEVTGLNNDGVKFTVNGSAAFTVDLTMEPLDPNLQNLEFDYLKNGAESGNRVSAAATNFQFNAGETIVIPLEPGVSNPQVVFRNAFNESRVAWYDGTATGMSNYYLVDSEYETTGTETGLQKPSGKVDANRAGTTKIEFSNIKKLTKRQDGATHYEETPFNKTNAGYSNITLATTPQTVYIYSADKPEYPIMTEAGKNLNNHIAYTFYDATLQGSIIDEEPVITVTPLFTTSLKRNNQKVAVYNAQVPGANVSVADDSATDTEHTFYGVTVTAKKADGTSGTVYGYLSSEDIESYIEAAMADKDGIYDGDVMRTILYVDMSSLKSISGNESSWKKMMLGTADNCLFFMPTSFSIAQEMQFGGIVAGGEAGRAVTDIVVIDQQPFFSPHSFYTSTHVARYERTQTNDKPTVTKSTLVLPFSIMLNSNGNPKPTTDSEDTKVTFYNLNSMTLYTDHRAEDGTYLDGVAGKITASPVATGTAVANTPYYVTSTENDAKTSFKIQVQGATFAKTTLNEMTATSGDMTAHGSYNGQEKNKEDQVLYWSKDYFWYSVSDYLKANTVKFLPFRAYYTTSAPLTAKEGKFILMFNETGETDGIEDGLSRQQQAIQSVYDLQGRKLSVGSDQLSTLSKGIYIVNGKKIFVK